MSELVEDRSHDVVLRMSMIASPGGGMPSVRSGASS